jgi:hypothetical protein
MEELRLYMLLLGCKPPGRHTEQHDVFFSIGQSLASLKAEIIHFWPEAEGKIHVDAYREVNWVDGFRVRVALRGRDDVPAIDRKEKLFFINLGGYKKNEFEEYHYKMLSVGKEKGAAVQKSLLTSFYLHTGFEGATSHVDDKYGIDVDDLYQIEDVLPPGQKEKYMLIVEPVTPMIPDEIFLGYFKLDKF